MLVQADTFFSQAIDIRGHDTRAVEADVIPAQIIGKDENDIRAVGWAGFRVGFLLHASRKCKCRGTGSYCFQKISTA
jgi:hypothetical protein